MRLTKTEKAAVAVLFASGEPILVSRLAQVFDCDDAAAHWMMRFGWMTNINWQRGKSFRSR